MSTNAQQQRNAEEFNLANFMKDPDSFAYTPEARNAVTGLGGAIAMNQAISQARGAVSENTGIAVASDDAINSIPQSVRDSIQIG